MEFTHIDANGNAVMVDVSESRPPSALRSPPGASR